MDQQKILLLLKGHPGSGKSTLACGLARELSWPLIDKDDVRDLTVSLQDSPVCCPPGVLNSLSYRVMWRMAERQLSLGLSVVVDCPLARPALFQTATEIAKRQSALISVVECRPSDVAEWRRRLESRASPALTSATERPQPSTPSNLERNKCARSELPSGSYGGSPCAKVKDEEPLLGTKKDEGACVGSKVRGWHKPATWADMESILNDYNGCYEYDMGLIPVLVLDTTALEAEKVLSQAVGWVRTLRGA